MDNLREKLDLTPEQLKAFNRMKRAFNDCKKLGVHFEQSHESLIALNGENVLSVEESNGDFADNEIDIQECSHNYFEIGVNPWIDVTVAITVNV